MTDIPVIEGNIEERTESSQTLYACIYRWENSTQWLSFGEPYENLEGAINVANNTKEALDSPRDRIIVKIVRFEVPIILEKQDG